VRNTEAAVGRASVGGRSGQGLAWPRLQARRMMIRELGAVCAALVLRAVVPSAHTRGLLGQIGRCGTMAAGGIDF